jgi:hypothetical protein
LGDISRQRTIQPNLLEIAVSGSRCRAPTIVTLRKNMKHHISHHSQTKLPETRPEHTSAPEFEHYKWARLDGYHVVNALLEGKFATGMHDVAHFEQVIQEHFAMEPNKIAPWHRSPLAQAACRDGMRLAALEFCWEHHDKVCLPGPSEGRAAPIKGSKSKAPSQCSAQCGITDEIQNSTMKGREPELSERSQKHLTACNSCRAQLPFWLDLARALREVNEEDEMIWAAEAGDPAIAQRNLAGGLALFKPAANSISSGLLLIVDPDNWMEVRSVHKNVTRQDFLAMS